MTTELGDLASSRLAQKVAKEAARAKTAQEKHRRHLDRENRKNTFILQGTERNSAKKSFNVSNGEELVVELGNGKSVTFTPRVFDSIFQDSEGVDKADITVRQEFPNQDREAVEKKFRALSSTTLVLGGDSEDLSDSVSLYTGKQQPNKPQALVRVDKPGFISHHFTVEALPTRTVTVKKQDKPIDPQLGAFIMATPFWYPGYIPLLRRIHPKKI